MLTALFRESGTVDDSVISKLRLDIVKIPRGKGFIQQRQEIWRIKARSCLGSSLLVEEAEILCKTGQPSEAWEALKIAFRVFVAPVEHSNASRGFAVAGEVALSYGDYRLGLALFEESVAQIRAARVSGVELLTTRIRAARGIANCLLISASTGSPLIAFTDLDITASDAREAAKQNAAFASGAANLEAFCIVRDAIMARNNVIASHHPGRHVKRLAVLDSRLRDIDPLGAAYRAVNIGQVLLILGHYSDASDLLHQGQQRLLSLGEICNASVAGHQRVEALVKGMRASGRTENFSHALGILRESVQFAGQVSNHDRYWSKMLTNLQCMERVASRSLSDTTRLEIGDGGDAPSDLGPLLPGDWPFLTYKLRKLAAGRGGRVRLWPRANAQEMTDLRSDIDAVFKM